MSESGQSEKKSFARSRSGVRQIADIQSAALHSDELRADISDRWDDKFASRFETASDTSKNEPPSDPVPVAYPTTTSVQATSASNMSLQTCESLRPVRAGT